MASVLDTVKHAMLEYPTISPTVGAALHQMFCVNGNGMEWVKGELVSWDKLELPVDVEKIAAGERVKFQDKIAEVKQKFPEIDMALMYEQELYEYEFRVKNIDRIVSDKGFRQAAVAGDLYPYSTYAKIACVPEDVKDDWLWAAYHFTSNLQIKFQGQYSLSAEDQTWQTVVNGVNARFSDMLRARGLMASREQQKAMMDRVMAEIKAEEKATL